MVAGDPRRGQRGDVQRSRQKLVSDLRRRQRIRPATGPFAWYRADRLDLTDGDLVTEWRDQSGNGRHVSPATDDAPVYRADVLEGRDAVDFGDVAKRLESTFADAGPFDRMTTLFVVAVTDPGVTVMGYADHTVSGDFLNNFLSEADSWWELSTWDDDDTTQIFPTPGIQSGDRIAEARRTADELRVVVDDSTVGTGSNAVGAITVDRLIVGGDWDQGYMGEAVFLAGSQVDDRDSWYADLKDRWGL